MTMYRTQSANVLNEADRFQLQLDWMLFAQEQDARLYSEDDWRPGDPLYTHPYGIHDSGMFSEDGVMPAPRRSGNTPRPIIQLVDEYEQTPTCPDCGVSWRVKVDPECWMCGKDYSFTSMLSYQGLLDYIRQNLALETTAAELIEHFGIRVNETAQTITSGLTVFGPPPESAQAEAFQRDIPERIVTASISESAADPLDENPAHPRDAVWRRAARHPGVTLPDMTPEQLGSQARVVPLPDAPIVPEHDFQQLARDYQNERNARLWQSLQTS